MGIIALIALIMQEEQENDPPVMISESVRKRLQAQMKELEKVKSEQKAFDTKPEPVDNQALTNQDSELTRNKNYWKKRLDDLQANQDKVKKVLERAREQGYMDVVGQGAPSESKSKTSEKTWTCEDHLSAMKSCYKENSKEPLKCEKEVCNFLACVSRNRAESLKTKQPEDTAESLKTKQPEDRAEFAKTKQPEKKGKNSFWYSVWND